MAERLITGLLLALACIACKDEEPEPQPDELTLTSLKIDDVEVLDSPRIAEVSGTPVFKLTFSAAVKPEYLDRAYIIIGSSSSLNFNASANGTEVTVSAVGLLPHFSRQLFRISGEVTGVNGEKLSGQVLRYFYTAIDSTPKFPLLTDDELLTLVQQQTFKYFWDFAHASSGLARERDTSGDVVTIGGSGFGVMTLIVAMERGFITRQAGLERLDTIMHFLETCARFHGAWPHWLNGSTGEIVPFSSTDDGGDLVETSFMIQGLLTMRQYLDSTIVPEHDLIDRINAMADSVEYDWFTNNENALYWLWSPNNGYILRIQGYNETLITYVLAASSKTHSVSEQSYHEGYAGNGAIENGNSYFGYELPLGQAYGGPLFFTHYSFLGLDPRGLSDMYCDDYLVQNTNQSLINHAYCAANPKNFVGYSDACWGLTASDNQNGYSAHSPTNDLGVITPTAALSSFPYTPEESMKALKFFYYTIGDKTWGAYGFHDAFNPTAGWFGDSYLAIDEGPIVVMIENYRTGLLWDLFMSCPEVQAGLDKLGFTY